MVDRPDGIFLFRLHKERVFYMSERVLKHSGHIPKKELLSAGVCIGKFTHSRKFRLLITALDYLARLAQYRVWLKPSGEQHFVYGNHVVKIPCTKQSEASTTRCWLERCASASASSTMAETGAPVPAGVSGSILVFRGWGADKPGICQAFLGIVVEHQSEVLDMAQFLLGGGLMFTFVLKVADQSSIGLMKSLTSCAKEQGLQLNFHFPDAGQVPEAEGGNEAVISVVSSSSITPALMFDIDKVFWGHGCVVLEIEHRSDNMKEHNSEYNKVQIRIRCPAGLRLATLIMGPAGGEVEGLQKVAWEHGGEVTARWWDAMNRPNGKSLVVFGLSNVLCPDDVLDLVLREAGVDPASVKTESAQPGAAESTKLAMLKGQSTQLVRKVIDHLTFTPGAKVVCSAMKRLGCRLAILTNTGMREIAEHVKSQLGFDYVICRDVEIEDGCFTGRYLGELSDVKFRKADLLKLMAEREGVDCRNVITVGEPLKGLKAANARLMLENFGPNVFFNSTKMPDLTIVLYLLGFSGSDVRALRKRRWDDGPGTQVTHPDLARSAIPALDKPAAKAKANSFPAYDVNRKESMGMVVVQTRKASGGPGPPSLTHVVQLAVINEEMQLAYQKERAKFAADVSKLEGEITEIESQQLDAYKQIQHAADTGWPEKPAISRIAAEEGEALTTVIAFGGTGGFTGCLVPPSRTRDRCCEADLVAEPSPESGAAFTGLLATGQLPWFLSTMFAPTLKDASEPNKIRAAFHMTANFLDRHRAVCSVYRIFIGQRPASVRALGQAAARISEDSCLLLISHISLMLLDGHTSLGQWLLPDLHAVQRSQEPSGSAVPPSPAAKRFMVQVSAQTRTAGQLQRIFHPLAPLRNDVQLTTVRQCSLQDGGMCLGLDLTVLKAQPDAVVKELVYTCQKEGFAIMDVNDSAKDYNWQLRYQNRYVVTLVQKPNISSTSLSEVMSVFGTKGINIIKIERLSSRDIASLQFTVSLPESLSSDEFSKHLVDVSKRQGADIAIQRDDLERWMRRLVVFDMDSTLIQQEVIDELAKLAGVESQVKEITEAAMRGELDFFGSLKSRVALLKGHNAEELFAKVKANLIFTPGAKQLCTCLKRLGFKTAVISGGFLPVAQEVQKYLGLDYAFANTLEVDETTGLLTGKTSGPVVTPQRKRQLLATIANVEGCEIQQTIAVGDGANDIPMLHAAGLGIAFCAKPKVQEVSRFRINQMDLSTVLFLIGISERAMERLADESKS
ncbi:unnamed protein product [Symbiodinium microadriaticum]|nr:unnamed protein product [Symbiodinium microadriaticum]CAE7941104.1 unnamed protein product [Symbiodinium sp. KB8]